MYMYVSTLRLSKEWWRGSTQERAKWIQPVMDLEPRMHFLKLYASMRWDSDLIVWLGSEDTGGILDFKYTLRSKLSGIVKESFSLFSIYEPSPYTRMPGEVPREQTKYFIAYPMKKDVEWYLLNFEERQKVMAEHIGMARSHPEGKGIKSYTTYAFGIGDYEFVVMYETDSLVAWSHVTEKLREARARKWITKEDPILVGETSDVYLKKLA